MWKMSAKREKLTYASMGHLQSFKYLKMESGEDDNGWKNKKSALLYVAISLQIHIFTKMSFGHSELQKCHYGLKMLAQWRERVDWHGANVAMMWKSRGNSLLTLR